MAFTGGYFNSWIEESAKIMLGLAPLPTAAESELLLFNPPSPITSATELADILTAELPATNGYARFNLGYLAGDVTWDAGDRAAKVAQKEWVLTATGGPIQWAGIAMIVDSGGVNERLVAGYYSDVLLTIPEGTSHTFQWSLAGFNTILDQGSSW